MYLSKLATFFKGLQEDCFLLFSCLIFGVNPIIYISFWLFQVSVWIRVSSIETWFLIFSNKGFLDPHFDWKFSWVYLHSEISIKQHKKTFKTYQALVRSNLGKYSGSREHDRTIEVPLSKVLNPAMYELATHSGVYPAVAHLQLGLCSSTIFVNQNGIKQFRKSEEEISKKNNQINSDICTHMCAQRKFVYDFNADLWITAFGFRMYSKYKLYTKKVAFWLQKWLQKKLAEIKTWGSKLLSQLLRCRSTLTSVDTLYHRYIDR